MTLLNYKAAYIIFVCYCTLWNLNINIYEYKTKVKQ